MKNINQFPIQKIPMSKKTQDWRESCVDYIIGHSQGGSRNGNTRTRKEEMQTYYDLYNSIYNEKDLKYVTNPFKQQDGFPAMAQDYNIIKPKIDLLLGEETKRPFNFKVVRTSEIATSELQEKAKQMLLDYIQATIMSKLGPEEQARYQEALQSGEIMPPEQIQKYMSKDYKDIAEITAYHSLMYLKNKLNINHEFFKGWKDALVGGEEIYYIGIVNGEPCLERINPIYFDYDTETSDLEFIHEAQWCCYEMNMSVTELYDRLYDKMTEKQLNELLDMMSDSAKGGINPEVRKTSLDYPHIKTHTINGFSSNPFDGSGDNIKVYHVCWKSFKKIGFVTIIDPETGMPETYEVDETYKETGMEISVEWKWIIETWEGYRAGEDLYIGIEPVEYQYVSSDNPNAQRLPYTGVIYNNTNSRPRSLVSMMKPLQYMYIVLWYRLELAMARDKGKVVNMDITQIPKSMNIDVSKWMHYLSALGVNFINPYEEGWDIPGREGGKPSQFNQITALDLTMANTINQYIMLMDKIESMLSEISGVSKQREGSISSNELVGNVERSVQQSAHITEPWFWTHNQVKRECLNMLLNTAKWAWKDGSKTHLQYILDDATRAFLTLSDNFPYEDFDIFVDDSTKNQQNIEFLRSLIQPAMQNGASLLDVVEIFTNDNTTMIRNKLEEIEQKRMEQQQAMEEAQAQREQQMIQMQNEVKEEELMIKEAEMDLKKYEIDSNNATKITVAQLNAYRGAEDMDQNNNGIPDPMEIAAQALAERKQASEEASKQFEFNAKLREQQMKKDIEEKKVALEKQKLQSQKELQKMKDDAALEREKLKAKTALKNKTNAEAARGK
ncbi:phage portal protein [uncultured phage cr105_1]|uniref:Phage portal protein n=3 Tax=Viruses TaxID=10239 RepID=A0AA48WWX1_9CAUD|nr:phage portal protein [uncultured phage cr105_1]